MTDAPAAHAVRLAPLAIEDLIGLHRWVAGAAGVPVADGWLDRIEARIAGLAHHPRRGAARDDLAPGLRTLSFERRLIVVYQVGDRTVDVLRVLDARRDLPELFS